jgi:hypothetical protein
VYKLYGYPVGELEGDNTKGTVPFVYFFHQASSFFLLPFIGDKVIRFSDPVISIFISSQAGNNRRILFWNFLPEYLAIRTK